MKRPNKIIAFLLANIFLMQALPAQSRKELEKKRKKTESEIALTKKILNETRNKKNPPYPTTMMSTSSCFAGKLITPACWTLGVGASAAGWTNRRSRIVRARGRGGAIHAGAR